jgi:HK97 gp10 family phage protein
MRARGSTAVSVKVEGLKELQAALAELSKATQRNTIRRSLISAAKPFVDRAKTLVPVDTGDLKNAIVAGGKIEAAGKAEYAEVKRSGGSDADALAAMRTARRSGKGSEIVIYAGVQKLAWYAHFVEFGTEKKQARPFIRPAWDAEKDNMMEAIKRDLKANIDKAVARAARKALRKAKAGG